MWSRIAIVAASLLVASSFGLEENAWGPSDSVHALDAVIVAVNQMVANPHISPQNLEKAKHVAEDVKKDVEAVESGNMTKEQAHEKVGAAIKELSAFKQDISEQVATPTEVRLASLQKQLAEKKALLAKDENMIKLIKLKKELAEKKLMLQKLIDQKSAAASSRKADQEEAAKTSAIVKQLMAVSKSFASTTKDSAKQDLSAPLKAVLASTRTREHEVSDALAKMENEEKKAEDSLDATLKKQMPTQGNGDALAKGQAMLKTIKAQEHRKFAKARALKQIELKELKDAEASIEKKDAAGFKKVLLKMQHDSQALQAKSGNFIY